MTTLDERLAALLDDRGTAPGAAASGASATSPTLTGASADPSRAAEPRLRVVLLLEVLDGKQERFLAAYETIRHQVAAVPGHISDQLCQSLGNSSQWLITSEWESSELFLQWVDSAEHREMVQPLHGCVRDTTSLRFVVTRETPAPAQRGTARPAPARHDPAQPGTAQHDPAQHDARGTAAGRERAPRAGTDPLPAPPLCHGGVVRHAITFTVKPGSEPRAAELLANYASPKAQVDDATRLLRTTLFMHGNRVVRAVEVRGDLGNALRHVAAQPEVRAVEEALNPYLEEDRDLTDQTSARAFFARAALPAVEHAADPAGAGAEGAAGLTRYAFLHPVQAAQGPEQARRLAALDAEDCAAPGHPLAAATVFQRDDVLVRLLDVRGPGADPAGLARGGQQMELITDRTSDDGPDRASGRDDRPSEPTAPRGA